MEEKLKQNQLARVQSTFTVDKAKELPEGEFEAILSTEVLDRHGERVSIKGMTIPKRTVRMYFNHLKWGETLPIGTWTRIWKTKDGKLMGRGKIDLVDEFERKIAAKIKSGTLDSISIGFMPKEWDANSDTWTKSELSEASVVNEPANPEALMTAKSQEEQADIDKSLKEKLQVIEEGDPEPDTETEPVEAGDSIAELKAALEDLNSRQGALEEAMKAASENPAKKSLERVRVALKQVDKSAENANRIIKVKLKES